MFYLSFSTSSEEFLNFIFQIITPGSVKHEPTTLMSLGSLLEMQELSFHPRPGDPDCISTSYDHSRAYETLRSTGPLIHFSFLFTLFNNTSINVVICHSFNFQQELLFSYCFLGTPTIFAQISLSMPSLQITFLKVLFCFFHDPFSF